MNKKYIGILIATLFIVQIVPVAVNALQNPDIQVDQNPNKPLIKGPIYAKLGEDCEYTAVSFDPQDDPIYYDIEFSDSPRAETKRMGPYESGETIEFEHAWDDFYQNTNPYKVRVKAIDDEGHASEWGKFITRIRKDVSINDQIMDMKLFRIISNILEQFFNIQVM